MNKAKVAITKGDDPKRLVRDALSLLNGLDKRCLGKVLIKPNLWVGATRMCSGATTRIEVIEGLVEFLQDLGTHVVIGEGSMASHITERAFENTRVKELRNKYGIKIVNLNEDDFVSVRIHNGVALNSLKLSKEVLESDVIVSVPVLKTHVMTGVSLSLKNMIGIVWGRDKHKLHEKDLDQAIVDLNTMVKPDLAVIDGMTGMEGRGPNLGKSVDMNVLIASFDPVAADSVGTQIMGMRPKSIRHLRLAAIRKLGTLDEIEIVGSPMKEVGKEFEPAKLDHLIDKVNANPLFHKVAKNPLLHKLLYNRHFYYTQKKLRWSKKKHEINVYTPNYDVLQKKGDN